MAEFCTNCALEMGFCKPDIDVEEIASELDNGYQIGPYICEHCGLAYVKKDEDGKVWVMVDDEGKGIWIPFIRGEDEFPDCEDYSGINYEF